ncbi:pitrilysin family protein [soil metagenome]
MILNNGTRNPIGLSSMVKTIAALAAIVFFCSIVPAQSLTTTSGAFEQIKLPQNTPNPQNIRQYRLKSNGMDVILCERHATPIVTTMVVYHIGSRNEAVGYTGSTHFLEHMMFKGTKEHDPLKKTGFDDLLKPIGGYNNATTSQDRTNYFEIVPAKSLPLTLAIESDRMQHLLLRSTDRASEMTVVRNELERGEDDSRELLENNTFSTAFKEHPYHHPVIGWRSDVEGVPIERLRQFYKDFYYPNNATLILVGDFKTEPTLALIQKYFGAIAKAPKPYPKVYTTEPPQEGERRYTVKRGSESPKLEIAYHSPRALDKDQITLTIMESLLGDESKRSSRLYKRLIDTSLASDVNTSNYQMHDPGLFSVTAAASPNVPLEKVEKESIKEIDRLKTEPVPIDELNRAKQAIVKRLKLEVSDPVGLADQLTEAIATSDLKWWLSFSNKIQAVTQADIMRVAKKYFGEDNRTVGYYLPKTAAATEIVSEPSAGTSIDSDTEPPVMAADNSVKTRTASPTSAIAANFSSRVKKQILPNGLTVVVMPIPGTGTVAISGKIQAGTIFRDFHQTQVPEFVADMLTKGSASYSKEGLAKRLEEMGTSLAFGEDDFWVSFDTEVITEDFPSLMEMASDCIRKPKFSSSELTKTKKQKHSILKDRISSTSDQSWNAFTRAVYKPDSVYYDKKFEDQIAELDKMDVSDLRAYHEAHYIPANTVLTVVGDINPDDAIAVIAKQFQDWSGGERQPIKISESQLLPNKPTTLTVPLPDKANIDVIMGHPVPVSIQTTDYAATCVGNAAFGYDSFACRLGPVRDQYGLTYSISSYLASPAKKYAPWAIGFSVNPENYNKTVSLVSKILSDYVKSGITPRELSIEKSHLSGAFYVGMRSAKQISGRLCEYEILGVGAKYMDEYAKIINAVTIDEVNAAIRKYFQVNQLTISASGTFRPAEQKK